MATTKPRITITLEPRDYELIKELSELNGESMSSIVSGLVGATEPVLRRVVEAGRAFRDVSAEALQDVQTLVEDVETDVIPAFKVLEGQFLSSMDAIAAAARGEDDPRLVTRGSRPPTQKDDPAGNGA